MIYLKITEWAGFMTTPMPLILLKAYGKYEMITILVFFQAFFGSEKEICVKGVTFKLNVLYG